MTAAPTPPRSRSVACAAAAAEGCASSASTGNRHRPMPSTTRSRARAVYYSMPASNRSCGALGLAATVACGVYYIAWAVLMPFLPADAAVQAWFADRVWAVRLPALVLVVGLGSVGLFIGNALREDLDQEEG